MRFPIPLKLILAFGAIVAVVTYASVETLSGIGRIHDTTISKLRDDTIPGLDQMGRISYQLALVRGDFWRQAFFEDPVRRQALRKRMEEERVKLVEAMKTYEAAIGRDEDRQVFAILTARIDSYLSLMNAARDLLDAKDKEGFT